MYLCHKHEHRCDQVMPHDGILGLYSPKLNVCESVRRRFTEILIEMAQ